MANKQINDLQLRSDFDDTCNVPVDDASQTWRSTGAKIKAWIKAWLYIDPVLITGQTADTSPSVDDSILTYDLSATALKKVSKADLLKVVSSAKTTTETLGASDSFVTVDATAGVFTLTLPTAVGIAGKEYTIRKIGTDTNKVTLASTSSQTIGGKAATYYSFFIQRDFLRIISDGANWIVLNERYTVKISAYQSAALNTPGAAAQINYDTKLQDVRSLVTTGAGAWKFTADTDGEYLVTGTNWINSSSYIYIYKNGALFRYIAAHAGTSEGVAKSYAVKVPMVATDYIDVRTELSVSVTGGDPTVSGSSFIDIVRIAD